jgi:hypothetical protein
MEKISISINKNDLLEEVIIDNDNSDDNETNQSVDIQDCISYFFKKILLFILTSSYYLPFIICDLFFTLFFTQYSVYLPKDKEVSYTLLYYLLFSGITGIMIYGTTVIGIFTIKRQNDSCINILYNHENKLYDNKLNLGLFIFNVILTIYGGILFFMYGTHHYDTNDDINGTNASNIINQYLKTQLIIKIITLFISFSRFLCKYYYTDTTSDNISDTENNLENASETENDCEINSNNSDIKNVNKCTSLIFCSEKTLLSVIFSIYYIPFIICDLILSANIAGIFYLCNIIGSSKCSDIITITYFIKIAGFYLLFSGILGIVIYTNTLSSIINVDNKNLSLLEIFYEHENKLNKKSFNSILFILNIGITIFGAIIAWLYRSEWGGYNYIIIQIIIKLITLSFSSCRFTYNYIKNN